MRFVGKMLFRILSLLAVASTAVLVTLKVTDNLDEPWWVVLSPALIYVLVLLIAVLSALITVSTIVHVLDEQEKKEEEELYER